MPLSLLLSSSIIQYHFGTFPPLIINTTFAPLTFRQHLRLHLTARRRRKVSLPLLSFECRSSAFPSRHCSFYSYPFQTITREREMASKLTEFAHLQIPIEDVIKATDNFSRANIIGHAGFGPAYNGRLLWSGELMKIAAVRLDRKCGLGNLEFWTEISVLSDLKHTNIVSLVGFCDEKHEKIMVIRHDANGSLMKHLNNPNLTLTQRLKISVGVARALSYLHHDEGRGYGVIHRNINSSTILLDENWEPKLSSFMFSIKQPDSRMDQVVLCEPIGISGYEDPAIEKIRGAFHASDIYSFGVVLFELLICGREAFAEDVNNLLAPLVKHHIKNDALDDIIPPYLQSQLVSATSFSSFTNVAYSCLKEEPTQRPNIKSVLLDLEKSLELLLERENQILENNLERFKIPLHDLKLATDNFSETYEVQSNDYYNVYRAELDHFDIRNHSFVEEENKGQHRKIHNTVVIETFLIGFDMDVEERFYRSVRMLTNVKHRNMVTVLGFCVEACWMILVTENFCEYLDDALENINVRVLPWEKRLKICIDVAHALKQLHSDMIIHRDISPYTIVLDENLVAKIGHFFFSVFAPSKEEDEALNIIWYGRTSYIDPECKEISKLKRESDVYSFGVILFEILCGKHAYDPIYLTDSEKGLSGVVRQRYNMGTLKDMVDPLLNDETDENSIFLNRGPSKVSLDTFIEIAFWCIAETQNERPTMEDVTKELEKALLFQLNGDRVERPDIDEVVHRHEKTPERELSNENIHVTLKTSNL